MLNFTCECDGTPPCCPECGGCYDCLECSCPEGDAIYASFVEVPMPRIEPNGLDLSRASPSQMDDFCRGWQANSQGEPFDHAGSAAWQEGWRFAKMRPFLD